MKRAPTLAIAAAGALAFSASAGAQAMTKSEYQVGKDGIHAEAKDREEGRLRSARRQRKGHLHGAGRRP
jgi:hypothetical protein